LNEIPFDGEIADPRLENHRRPRWALLTGAIQMKLPPADVDQPAEWREGRSDGLILGRGDRCNQGNCRYPNVTS
jgi:hypothetical protein